MSSGLVRGRRSRRRIATGAILLLTSVLAGRTAEAATQFILLGGLNLSSPRTALGISLTSFTALAAGFGFNIGIKDNFKIEPDILYVIRRYSAGYSLPTLTLPVLLKFEVRWLFLGIGPYMGNLLGSSSDSGAPSTPDLLAMSSIDFGVVVQGGLKLPLTKSVTVVLDGRVMRALTEAYGGDYPFYWTQIQGYMGIEFSIGRKRGTVEVR